MSSPLDSGSSVLTTECTVVVLTLNEELHLSRAISSVAPFADRVVVVDSGSTDRTVAIAKELGAEVLSHPFVTQARQFNWALTQLPEESGWIFRLDADEFVTDSLAKEIKDRLASLPLEVAAVSIGRRVNFLGSAVKRGGLFPVRVVRLFRYGRGRSEDRWMDEHIIADGATVDFQGEIIDDNLNTLTWWTDKHNSYASREAVELLNLEYEFMERDPSTELQAGGQAGTKRWLKQKIYARLPGGLRAFLYFLYRYIFRLGFLDGPKGTTFHILQGFWYRYLVDAKAHEVKAYMFRNDVDAVEAIKEVLGIDVAH